MGTIIERIRLILEADASGANRGLGGFRTSVMGADGAVGKFKAGAASAFESAKANAGALALAGGAALVAFGIKALGAFTEVADAARDFGAATGQSVEDASRWSAIADDIGLTAADLQAGFGMVTKSLDASKWAEYGIATRDAGGEARSTNEILLDTFDVLSRETNLTERARLGKALLGKGYAGLAPMIGKTRAEYEKMLGAVEDGQVITDKELAKSERMKKAQDSLSDALGEVTLAFGEMVAELAPTIEALANSVGWVVDLNESVENLTGGLGIFSGGLANATGLLDSMGQATGIVSEIIAEQEAATRSAANATKFAAAEHNDAAAAAESLAAGQRGLSGDTRKAKEAFEGAATAAAALERRYDQLTGKLNNREAWLVVQQAARDHTAVMKDSEATDADKELSLIRLQREMAEYAKGIEGIPPEKLTEVLALIDQGKLSDAEYALGVLTADRDVRITPIIAKGANGSFTIVAGKQFAHGTTSAPPGMALVGETGPELVNFGGGETVHTAAESARMMQSGAGGGPSLTVNAYGITDVAALARLASTEMAWLMKTRAA